MSINYRNLVYLIYKYSNLFGKRKLQSITTRFHKILKFRAKTGQRFCTPYATGHVVVHFGAKVGKSSPTHFQVTQALRDLLSLNKFLTKITGTPNVRALQDHADCNKPTYLLHTYNISRISMSNQTNGQTVSCRIQNGRLSFTFFESSQCPPSRRLKSCTNESYAVLKAQFYFDMYRGNLPERVLVNSKQQTPHVTKSLMTNGQAAHSSASLKTTTCGLHKDENEASNSAIALYCPSYSSTGNSFEAVILLYIWSKYGYRTTVPFVCAIRR
ncbi:hypothetical protein J6590_007773 [Homalodisca vitripennis]|nr:hypothetical protein J6590_007773 [Homalodisca vitripennis]